MAYRVLCCVLLAALLPQPAGTADGTGPPATENSPVSRGRIDYRRTIDSTVLERLTKPRSFWSKLVEWVAGPGERAGFARPYGLTEDSRGRLLITDPDQQLVHIVDLERNHYDVLTGSKKEPFWTPVGVAVDAKDNIYVTDSGRGRIYVFGRKGKFRRSLGGGRNGVTLDRPTGIALDNARERIWVADTGRHQILVLDYDGNLLRTIGRRGVGHGEFNFPTALALARGKLYVVDAMNFRIQIFSREGKHVRSFGGVGNRTGTFYRPKGIALDSDGNVYVVDSQFETVQVFDDEGRLLYYFGSGGNGEGQLGLPSGIFITERDQILVADSLNRRIQVFLYRRVR